MPPSSSSFPLASCIAICKSREQDLLLSFLVRRFFQRSIWLCLPESKGRNHFKSHPPISSSFFSFIGPSRRRWPEKLNPSQWNPSIPDMIATWKRLEMTIKWCKLQNMKETKTTWCKTTQNTSWWFQPIWKLYVKLDHFPKWGGK